MIPLFSLVAIWPAYAGQLSYGDWSPLEGADVVILGEVHDNFHHHDNQAAAVRALNPAALVFEHLTSDLARRVTSDLIADPALLGETLAWEERGWPDFGMYAGIFQAAPEAAYFGGGASVDIVRSAITDGAATAFGAEATLFALDQPYEADTQSALEAMQMSAHCDALPEEMLPGMVEAQRLRDATLASATRDALAATEARPVIVITGNGHASNTLALPALLEGLDQGLTVLSVGQFEESAPEDPDYDHWLVTPSVERPDPCDVFK